MTKETLDERIKHELAKAQSVVISSHIRPDGDAIGSMLGLAQALREQGKQVQCVLQDRIDPKFNGLTGATEIKAQIDAPYDYIIVVDSADRARTGEILDGIENIDLVIDHHISHINFGKIDLVEWEYEATALVLYEFMPLWGLEISKESAECLMTGIITDTLGFRTSNTSAKSLRAVAEMMDMGVNLPEIYFHALSSRSLAELRYWAHGLGKISYEEGIVWTSLSLQDREKSGYKTNDDADLVNQLSSMQGALMAIIFVEQPGGSVKVSWRSVPGINVSELAQAFGGGGHVAASGADIAGDLSSVLAKVLTKSKAFIAA